MENKDLFTVTVTKLKCDCCKGDNHISNYISHTKEDAYKFAAYYRSKNTKRYPRYNVSIN